MTQQSEKVFQSDIVIAGAGITGVSLARELSRYDVSVIVLERAEDVAEGATKANSGIVHAGYDAKPGTAKAKYNVLGAAMFPALCAELSVPYRKCGALVVGLMTMIVRLWKICCGAASPTASKISACSTGRKHSLPSPP